MFGNLYKFKQDLLRDDPVDTDWYQSINSTVNSTYDLPFIPYKSINLDNMSVSLNATHPSTGYTQYNTHSLFGHMEAKNTYEILTDNTTSPLPD